MRGGDGNAAARADMRVFGATEEEIDQQLGPAVTVFEVWPENWEALQAFLYTQTQWAVGPSGATGLDYTRMKDGLSMAGITVTPELFHKIRALESGALDALKKSQPSS